MNMAIILFRVSRKYLNKLMYIDTSGPAYTNPPKMEGGGNIVGIR